LPPKASIEEYVANIHNILEGEPRKPIGHLFTSYTLLKILLKDDAFRNRLKKKSPKLLEKADKYVGKL
jgi:hypothetical protein